ncbi:MAG: SPOR domain-containing protein [Pseudomonadota bacterium]
MSGTRSGRHTRQFAIPLLVVFGLATLGACAELQAAGATAGETNSVETQSGVGVQVAQATTTPKRPAAVSPLLAPAPDIFEARGRANWDGKRTLQGVWVAHPLAASARRVRIYNEQNGQAVDGALFKRDAALEGAAVLISSEAAELLGLVIGENTPLRIVAVKPIETPIEAPVQLSTEAEDKTDTPVESEATVETDGDDAQAVETEDKDPVKEETAETPAESEAEPETEVAAAPTPTAKPDPVDPDPEQPADAKPEPAASETATPEPATPEAATPEPAEAEPAETETAEVEPAEAEPAETELAKSEPAQPEPVEAEPAKTEPEQVELAKTEPEQVQPAKPEPAKEEVAAKDEDPDVDPPIRDRVFKFEDPPKEEPEAKQEQVAKAPAPQEASPLRRPFLAAGVFGVRSNATNLIARLKSKGIPAKSNKVNSGGKTLTRVVAGPFQNTNERNRARRELRKLGVRDAVPVRR